METAAVSDEVRDEAPQAKSPEGPKGIGGWLILPILHLISMIIFTCINLWPVLQNRNDFITIAIDPAYRWMLVPIAISLAAGIAVLALSGAALVMLCLKRRIFPVLMIGFYVFVLVDTIFETGLSLAFEEFKESPAEQAETLKELVRTIVAAAIWIPYFLVSKRVKATFVE
jgi:hypothetical protein